jgi:hypothetical protein
MSRYNIAFQLLKIYIAFAMHLEIYTMSRYIIKVMYLEKTKVLIAP